MEKKMEDVDFSFSQALEQASKTQRVENSIVGPLASISSEKGLTPADKLWHPRLLIDRQTGDCWFCLNCCKNPIHLDKKEKALQVLKSFFNLHPELKEKTIKLVTVEAPFILVFRTNKWHRIPYRYDPEDCSLTKYPFEKCDETLEECEDIDDDQEKRSERVRIIRASFKRNRRPYCGHDDE